jgi:transcriptional regulator with XRE-family HTH domain
VLSSGSRLSLLAHVVRLQRKRYHPLYTLQAQGRMHVQMKIHPHVRPVRSSTGGAADGLLRANAWGVGMISVQPGSGPTVLRILLGSQLRRLREAKGITREDAGYTIRASGSKISRMELGRVGFKERDVVDLLEMYGVADDSERDALVALAKQANTPGWWHKYSDVLPDWFQVYVGLEEAASLIRLYEVQFVPGLLQTADYARAVVALGQTGATEEEVERRVSLRVARQELLAKPGAPRLWAVVDEAALRRPIGGKEVMRSQLERLIAATKEPNITLQVMPFSSGGHAAEGGAFTIMRFPEVDLPDVVYLEQLTSALYLDKRDDVERYTEVMERLSVESESPEHTTEILSRMLEEVT